MIDWPLAERIAGTVAGDGDATPLAGDLTEICGDARQRVVAYAQLEPTGAIPPPESVTRKEWIGANLVSMRAMIDPVTARIAGGSPVTSPLRLAGEVAMTAETGAMTGYLGRRVLGQYELSLLDDVPSPRLLFVAPNIGGAATGLDADPLELLRWIAFHEMTHAVQFTAVPWLRGHIGGLIRELLAILDTEVKVGDLVRLPRRSDVTELVTRVRSGSLVGLVAGPRQRAVLDRVQGTMALVEGHAEHVMDAAGADALPSLTELRATLERRRAVRPPALKLLERLLGMEMKMKQYQQGKAFCDAVVDRGGIPLLNRAWSDPELLPTVAELSDPSRWVARAA